MTNEICISCGFPKEHGNCPACRKLTDNERIQEIREGAKLFVDSNGPRAIREVGYDINFLVKQLEQRDKTIAELRAGTNRALDDVVSMGKQNALMQSALEFYANQVNYMVSPLSHTQKPAVMEDFGQTARQSLTVSKQGVTSAAEPASEQTNK